MEKENRDIVLFTIATLYTGKDFLNSTLQWDFIKVKYSGTAKEKVK